MNTKLEALLSDTRDLVSVPEVYLEVRRVMDDPMSGAAEVAKAVSRDPALAVRFLRIANSALFARRSEITLVSHAVAMLGSQLVRDIVLAASVADLFNGVAPEIMDVRKYWARSVECGVLAKAIAEHIGVLDNEHVFIEGLLADLGHMLLFMQHGESMQRLAAEAQASGTNLASLEREALGFDYCAVGAAVALRWDLPESLVTVIGSHQDPAAAAKFQLETSIVHIAYRLADSADDTDLEIAPSAVALTECTAEIAVQIRAESSDTIAATTTTFSNLDQVA